MIEYMYGAKKPRKDRYVAAVITPASPYYVHGLIDSDQVRIIFTQRTLISDSYARTLKDSVFYTCKNVGIALLLQWMGTTPRARIYQVCSSAAANQGMWMM